ncbi:MAG: hypothetical protein KatS3mg103_0051 [Phycisphaerales bacterium]|nr:MAG: hypothetical protein KatS3mg103_0051 [Phycisphaerales bacterium]
MHDSADISTNRRLAGVVGLPAWSFWRPVLAQRAQACRKAGAGASLGGAWPVRAVQDPEGRATGA